jgi:uncharacterized protein YndB with AHSA1/START domain
MADKLVAKSSIVINAAVSKVWKALIDPAQIREYLFGTNAISDWKKGSPLTYEGEWQGKKYKDKGTIIDIIPEKLLHTTYWSSIGGKEDKPENYNNVIYELQPRGESTMVTISQDNIADEAGLKHMEENWGIVLNNMKKLLEK